MVQIKSASATDAAAETSYTIKATSPTGAVSDTSASFKLTMSVPCTTALAVATDTLRDETYYIVTSGTANVTMQDMPTYTVTPNSCTDKPALSVHPKSDLN